MQKLEPCPFCHKTSYLKVEPFFESSFEGYYGFTVVCSAAGFEGTERGCGSSGGWGETEDDAATAWNTRPSAPVEGLENLGFQSLDGETWVRRSQAEAVIAAKDEELLSLSNSLTFTDKLASQRLERAEKAEADNAALTARIKELEEQVRFHVDDAVKNWNEATKQEDRAEALETQLAAAEKALERIVKYSSPQSQASLIARAALEGKP